MKVAYTFTYVFLLYKRVHEEKLYKYILCVILLTFVLKLLKVFVKLMSFQSLKKKKKIVDEGIQWHIEPIEIKFSSQKQVHLDEIGHW